METLLVLAIDRDTYNGYNAF